MFWAIPYSFSGEIRVTRKHTRFIRRDLVALVQGSIGKLMTAWNHQAQRIQAYKTYDLTEARVHDIVVRSVDVGILPNRKLPELLHEWREPRHDEFAPRTAWSPFNGFTEALKGNLAELPRKTERLHGLLDTEVGVGINQQGERELQRSRVWSFRGPGGKGSAPRSGRGLFSY